MNANANVAHRFMLLSILPIWIAAPFVVAAVVTGNAKAGRYGVADVVLIPIMSAVVLCIVGLPYFAFFAVAASRRYFRPLQPWHFRSTVRHWLVLVAAVIGARVLLSELLYWWSWQHAPILVVYFGALVWLVWARPFAGEPRRVSL